MAPIDLVNFSANTCTAFLAFCNDVQMILKYLFRSATSTEQTSIPAGAVMAKSSNQNWKLKKSRSLIAWPPTPRQRIHSASWTFLKRRLIGWTFLDWITTLLRGHNKPVWSKQLLALFHLVFGIRDAELRSFVSNKSNRRIKIKYQKFFKSKYIL